MIYITRKEHFNAAHKLYNSKFSHEKNLELYGICSNENSSLTYNIEYSFFNHCCRYYGSTLFVRKFKVIKKQLIEFDIPELVSYL